MANKLNAKKCKVMHLGSRNSKTEYTMDRTNLSNVTKDKDLGVLINKELKFHDNISSAMSKANQTLGLFIHYMRTTTYSLQAPGETSP